MTAVPVSAFYGGDAPTSFIRLCFCKKNEVLDEVVARLSAWLHGEKREVIGG